MSYGTRRRPHFSRLRTREDQPMLDRYDPAASPREGRGDYRRYVDPSAGHRNPVLRYEAIRNGMPAPKPYKWRRQGWQQRLSGLDLDAIKTADRELAVASRQPTKVR